ncbi:transporter substrate-binding domain-containing protein [Vibrio sp. SCSIO 43136]|uniref:substrate-binding periplasmic protein n=1 Tax=Vibrio sp. SCSIO 43136 TaxID=2819101 RepID=UPI0020754CAB|nr:transporter substrate-binding domain-containing protein [Vibrio sp. SCSIO 43136]USD64022.1 transporter substrate-binding domain-containing protein [Vibrio sp. SCSIO 43136]
MKSWLQKIGVLTALGMLLLPTSAVAERATLKVGIFFLAPHMVIDEKEGKHSGATVEYFAKIAQEMDVDVEVKGYPFPRMMQQLYRGELDAVLFLAKNKDRAHRLGYPRMSYYETESTLAVMKDSPLEDVSNVETLKGLTIGTTAKVYKTPSMKHDWLVFDSITAGQSLYWQHFRKLHEGRIDAIYFPDKAALMFEANRAGFDNNALKYLSLPDPKTEVFVVFSEAASYEYLPRYERALIKVMREQTYQQFLLQYVVDTVGEKNSP